MQSAPQDEVYLSVVIPAYNEQARIADTIYAVKDYLAHQSYRSEVIVVDDGSADLTTEVVRTIDIYASEIKRQDVSIIMENVKNVGKGFSVARGMLAARGRYIMFTDADLAAPIEEVEKLLPFLESGWDVVIGSRRIGSAAAEQKSLARRMASALFNLIVQVFAVRGIYDTQCGFKAFTQSAAHRIARLQKTYRFSFDVEQLYIATCLGLRIKEVPVKYVHQEGSTVQTKDIVPMLLDVMNIRWLHRGLKSSSR
jgi:dolichyl-phosphate beta-glucosyltransferase